MLITAKMKIRYFLSAKILARPRRIAPKVFFAAVFLSGIYLASYKSLAQTLDSEQAGTISREEKEIKLAFPDPGSQQKIKILQDKLYSEIANSLKRKVWQFPQLVGGDYEITPGFEKFFFKDIYFDTPNRSLATSGRSYRLRYRWSNYANYIRYQAFPLMSSVWPTRCEIQYKRGYTWSGSIVKVQETRFEFRNDSEPFSMNFDAPPPPWPEDEYIGYASTGRYLNYEILPYAELALDLGLVAPPIAPAERLGTSRNRLHISLKNPWGSGPNPDQVFIVTLDEVLVESTLDGESSEPQKFLELEIEVDRNTSTVIDQLAAAQQKNIEKARGWTAPKNQPATKEERLARVSEAAYRALASDLDHFQKIVQKIMVTSLKAQPLKNLSKFQRASER